MRITTDFHQRMQGYATVTVSVLYYLPDQSSLLNEFVWQTLDIKPKYPRVKRFLDYWESEIQGKIKEVILCDGRPFAVQEWRNGLLILQDNYVY